MKNNEWNVAPGTQDNLTPEIAPMLSESECTLVNLYRALPAESELRLIKSMFELVRLVHENDDDK